MADLEKLNQSFDQMIQLMTQMKQSLQEGDAPTTPQPNAAKNPALDLNSFEKIKEALDSERWPEAVNPNLICDPTSETDKTERSRGIIELMIEEDLKGLKVLDYGCGEGHCAHLAIDYKPSLSVGFDPAGFDPAREDPENVVLTPDFAEAEKLGPYDIIILFDVIDHLKAEEPVALLNKVKSVLADDGKIYMRCHPYMARHATHLYHDLNKAFAHLVFTPEELKELVPNASYTEENIGVKYPLKTYHEYIADAGLRSINRRDISEKVEPFFKIPKIAERIMQNTEFDQFPEFQMSLQFIDFVLKK
jgi:2-polyprenyl-3-methyl-5-hydroxy-6-metoxy-1,4-benzoquinol methylase